MKRGIYDNPHEAIEQIIEDAELMLGTGLAKKLEAFTTARSANQLLVLANASVALARALLLTGTPAPPPEVAGGYPRELLLQCVNGHHVSSAVLPVPESDGQAPLWAWALPQRCGVCGNQRLTVLLDS